MHEYTAGDAVAVYAGECLSASFSVPDDPAYEEHIQEDDTGRSYESPFLADSTEDEVGALLRYESVCGLRAVEVALSEQSSRSDSDLGLVYIVSDSRRVFLHAEKYLNTLSLVVLKHVVEDEVSGEHQHDSGYHRQNGKVGEKTSLAVSEPDGKRSRYAKESKQDVQRLHLHRPWLRNACSCEITLRRSQCLKAFRTDDAVCPCIHYRRYERHKNDHRNACYEPESEPSRVQAYT